MDGCQKGIESGVEVLEALSLGLVVVGVEGPPAAELVGDKDRRGAPIITDPSAMLFLASSIRPAARVFGHLGDESATSGPDWSLRSETSLSVSSSTPCSLE